MKTESHARHDAEVQDRLIQELRQELGSARRLLLGFESVTTSEQKDAALRVAAAFAEAFRQDAA